MKATRRLIAAAMLASGLGAAYWAYQRTQPVEPHRPGSLEKLAEAARRLSFAGSDSDRTLPARQQDEHAQPAARELPEPWIDRQLKAVLATVIEERRLSQQPDSRQNARAIQAVRQRRQELYRQIAWRYPDTQVQ